MTMGTYVIRASIIRQADDSYVAKAAIECVDGHPPPEIEVAQPCEHCSYAQARSAAYRLIAELSYEIRKAGGDVMEVTIWDIPPASTEYHVTGP